MAEKILALKFANIFSKSANIKKTQLTQSSKNATLPAIIGPSHQFIMAIFYSKTFSKFFFDGQNVINFLNQFLDLCKNYKLLEDKKIKWLLKYCDMQIKQIIEIMKE